MAPTLIFALSTAGWTVANQADGCTYYKGATEGEVTPVRVECDWTDVDAGKLHALLGDPGRQARTFSGLAEAEVVDRSGPVTRVYQRFAARGMGDREVIVDYSSSNIDGGRRYRWRKSDNQSSLRGDAVEVPQTSGTWEVADKGDGHVKVTYELRMVVGGMVPSFALKWFQGAAIQQTIDELKSKVLSE